LNYIIADSFFSRKKKSFSSASQSLSIDKHSKIFIRISVGKLYLSTEIGFVILVRIAADDDDGLWVGNYDDDGLGVANYDDDDLGVANYDDEDD